MADVEDVISQECVQDLFAQATDYVRSLKNLRDEQKLLFYGLFKQATEGPCKTSRPGFWDIVGKAKWESWHQHGKMPQEKAMKIYVQELFSLDPEWDIKYATSDSTPITQEHSSRSSQSMGLSVSTLRGDEDDVISDGNKTAFDWCKEGNVKRMSSLISKKNINSPDEQGMSLLHWACDRGHDHVVDFLIKNNADVNITVSTSS
ncbi:acyl-CoA-binding domain-containing protein 6 isoform X2 [Nematostella vectensis]|uniref:acyl-CoA-binding domain-containing protein 6 isoform X2 n=1 Tax=Nematostella vectensis TaxID=45351 RepID=UPI0020778334|nr:acyl-CoA-binding domain-containing protein 6 isoform X2 [Nematostella vectensis]